MLEASESPPDRPPSTWLSTLVRILVFGFGTVLLYAGFAFTEDYPAAAATTWAISALVMGLALFRRGPLSFRRRLAIAVSGFLLMLPIALVLILIAFAVARLFD
jgi:hypothetical protein